MTTTATAAHACTWQPVEGEAGMYLCACGATGYRPRRGGAVVAHRSPKRFAGPLTAGQHRASSSRQRPDEYDPNTRDPDR